MRHLKEEELLEAYYGDADTSVQTHAATCAECRASMGQLKQILEDLGRYAVPVRDEGYGREVWERLAGQLPNPKCHWWRFEDTRQRWRSWMLVPALAMLLVLAFAGGVWTEHQRSLHSAKARERVLLLAMSDHLKRSQIVLAELLHAKADSSDFAGERERARNLLDENRLLRQSVVHSSDPSEAALLDDLERVLLDVANGTDQSSSGDLKTLQQRIENDGLLWRVRITSDISREKGQKL